MIELLVTTVLGTIPVLGVLALALMIRQALKDRDERIEQLRGERDALLNRLLPGLLPEPTPERERPTYDAPQWERMEREAMDRGDDL